MKSQNIFIYKLAEGLLFSSWAFLFLGLPLIVAFGLDSSVPWYFYPWALVFFGMFVFIPAGIGSIVALLVGTYFSHRPRRLLIGLGLVVLLIGGVWLAKSYPAFHLGSSGYQTYMRDVLGRFTWSRNPLLPSHWIAQGMLGASTGDPQRIREAIFYSLLILSNSMFLLAAGYWLSARIYLKGYQGFRSTSPRRRIRAVSHIDRVILALLCWLPDRIRVLVLKDIKTFRRDATQWSQALIFFGLIGVYVMNLRVLKYDLARIGFKNMVAFLNLTATSLTLATFTSRFVFPLLSLEGKRFWVLGLAPVRRSDLLMGKFAFSFIGCVAISGVLMLTSDLMLNIPQVVTFLHLFAVVVISAALSGLAVGLGAVHADLREDNPAKIVSGFGGTLNLVLSMFVVAAIVTAQALPCHYYLVKELVDERVFRLWIIGALVFTTVLGGAACIVPLLMGRRALNRMET